MVKVLWLFIVLKFIIKPMIKGKELIKIANTFHFCISMISRGKGKSAVASAAYISCEKLTNQWEGITHDYHTKKGLWNSEIFLPKGIPIDFKNRFTLWNSVELNDKGNAEKWRESFAHFCNKYLEKNNKSMRVDHRSYKRQGVEEIPTIHLGAGASALEKKGILEHLINNR